MKWLPFALLLLASPSAAECVTKCGLRAVGFDCQKLQELETRALKIFVKYVKEWTRPALCQALTGWRLEAHVPTALDELQCRGIKRWHFGSTKEGLPFCVSGYTRIANKVIEVADISLDSDTSVPHEFIHVFQYGLDENLGHCRWPERGLDAALLEITGKPDTSARACSE